MATGKGDRFVSTPGIRPLVAGNWKMNGSRDMARKLVADLVARAAGSELPVDLLVCPPFPYLSVVADALSGSSLSLGGQDCHTAAAGAHTGDVAAAMLRDLGAGAVILGHSERRADHGESSGLVAAKAKAAVAAGLTALVCVGETEAQRNAGDAEKIVENQIVESIPSGIGFADIVVAYEPVWAIGTGRTPTVADVAAMHRHIRALLTARDPLGAVVRILYGGSVKPGNAAELMAVPEVNGALVGGASLKAEDFWGIAEGAAKSAS
ncbi:MAG: triose-phosphate isomerase [Rhodospirillaceae bacterium]|nr:triose-phosphate isomerase [Rhodospirillaceae bacterium]